MGAWSYGSFDNDDAGDWVADFEDSTEMSVIVEALNGVTDDAEDYLDAAECSVAIAAAEVVAALCGRPSPFLPEEIAAWIMDKPRPGPDLLAKARRAIEAVQSDSELSGLWQDNVKDYPNWVASVEDLKARLVPVTDIPDSQNAVREGTAVRRPVRRKRYSPGTLLAIPLGDTEHAYICVLIGAAVGIFDFRTRGPLAPIDSIRKQKCRWHTWYLNLPKDAVEIGQANWDAEELEPPPVVERIPKMLVDALGLPPIRILHLGKYRPASEEEIVGLEEFRSMYGEDLTRFLVEHREELKMI